MKSVFTLILAIAIFSFQSYGISVQDSVSKAEQAYQDESYGEVITIYENILAEGFSSPELHYNLGNAYFKYNDFSKAVLHYEKCLKADPNHDDAKFNLNIAKLQQSDKIKEIPDFFMLIWYNDFISILTSNAWAYISIGLFLIVLILMYFYFFTSSRKTKKFSFIGITVFLIFFLSTATFSYSLMKLQTSTNNAIIMTPSLTVKSTPGENGKNLFVIHEGLKVKIEDDFNDWVKIKISNGNEGWVRKSDLAVI